MIVIKDQDFEMVQYKNTPFFDLKMPVKVNEGKPNERSEMSSWSRNAFSNLFTTDNFSST